MHVSVVKRERKRERGKKVQVRAYIREEEGDTKRKPERGEGGRKRGRVRRVHPMECGKIVIAIKYNH